MTYDGTAEAFSADAGWIGVGNQTSYQRREEGGAHDFGFSAETSHAGGMAGELGGVIWRSGVYGYYADRVGPLTLADRLEASGKVMLAAGPPDSGMYLGWFHSAHKENSPHQAGDFVGVRIGGPTRIGHYFVPAYATTQAAPVERRRRARAPRRGSASKAAKGRCSFRGRYFPGSWFTTLTGPAAKARFTRRWETSPSRFP